MPETPLTVTLQSLASETAFRLVGHATQEATRLGLRVAVAVVDVQGVPLAFCRMDGVSPPVVDFAHDKAYTAATLRRSTEAFGKRMDESPSLRMGMANRARLLVWGGGLPIWHGGAVVGGIGVSGAKDHEDIAIAASALAGEGLSADP